MRDSSSTPKALLQDFLHSGRSEASFTRLVQELGGLVYGSALRRTGDSHLSEEITQSVFTILSTKAESLSRHPALNAWLYRTTRFEAEKALKKERRHQRRVETFAHEAMPSSDELPVVSRDTLRLLEQALDRLSESDRQLVLARHYEGKKFREISAETNRTEEACRVRLRRILDQMSVWLARRGCTLSITALTALLSSELTKACPSSLVIKQALVSQSAFSLSAFISSILTTMNLSKKIALLAAVLISAVGVHSMTSRKPSPSSSQSSHSLIYQDRGETRETNHQEHSFENYLDSYPYATDRLEELYLKYPNLRRAPFTKPTSLTPKISRVPQRPTSWERALGSGSSG